MRPESLEFLEIQSPGAPTRLVWQVPAGRVTGYLVYRTARWFPPAMAPELFAGRMSEHVTEERLARGATSVVEAAAPRYCAVLWLDATDRARPVDGLRETFVTDAADDAFFVAEEIQGRTFVRARWSPRPERPETDRVELWIEPSRPEGADLRDRLDGRVPPTHVVPPGGDGFVDTESAEGFQTFYVAVAVDRTGDRQPLRLATGALLRLNAAVCPSVEGAARLEALNRAIEAQLEDDLKRRSLTRAALDERLERARDLAPDDPAWDRLELEAERRFGPRPG